MRDDAAAPAPQPDGALMLDLKFLSIDPVKVIYATIVLMTGLALYDEGTDPLASDRFVEMVTVTVAPLFALAMAHAFSEALAMQIQRQHRLTGHERRHLLASNLEYLYVAIPPVLLMAGLTLLGWDANDAVGLVQLLAIVSLFVWGVYAGHKAGLGRLRRISFGIGYGFMGLFVLLVELALTH